MSWFYSSGLGLFMVDKNINAATIINSSNNNLYPSIYNSSNGVGILTSNLDGFQLNVNGSTYVASNLNIRDTSNYIRYTSNMNYQGLELASKNGFGFIVDGEPICFGRNDSVTVTTPLYTSSILNTNFVTSAAMKTGFIHINNSNCYINYGSNDLIQMVGSGGGSLGLVNQRALYWDSNANIYIPGNLSVGSINGGNSITSYSRYNPLCQIHFGTASITMSLNNLSILPTSVLHTNGGYVSICTQAFAKKPYSMSNARLTMQGYLATNDPNLNTFQMKLVYNTDNVSPVQNWSSFLNIDNGNMALITFDNLRGRDYGLSTSCSDWFQYPSQFLNTNTPLYFGVVPTFPGGQFVYVRAHLDLF